MKSSCKLSFTYLPPKLLKSFTTLFILQHDKEITSIQILYINTTKFGFVFFLYLVSNLILLLEGRFGPGSKLNFGRRDFSLSVLSHYTPIQSSPVNQQLTYWDSINYMYIYLLSPPLDSLAEPLRSGLWKQNSRHVRADPTLFGCLCFIFARCLLLALLPELDLRL
ncbi:hypothetical protein ACOSQ4_000854 [Xanthoceras sorbifolium]